MKKAAICIVQNRAAAESVVSQLRSRGFSNDDISVLFPDKDGTKDFAHVENTKAPEGAIAGVGAGGLIGGTVGLLAGIGALAIPGAGPFIAAGPLLGALSGAASGATLGGIAGALVGMGIPEVEAKRYEGKIKGGNILISVHTENVDEQRRAKSVFEAAGADDIAITAESSVPHERTSHASL
ncbi:MAG TPA: general stress protein [Polyangiaceae bacterium]